MSDLAKQRYKLNRQLLKSATTTVKAYALLMANNVDTVFTDEWVAMVNTARDFLKQELEAELRISENKQA